MNIFSENHKFTCFVFSIALQTDRGKKFVREYEDDFDTQMVYKKLHRFYSTSVGARLIASYMLSHITLAEFDSWKGTTEYFILNWQDQVRLYEPLVDADKNYSENQKKILLENVVASVKHLHSIKDQAE